MTNRERGMKNGIPCLIPRSPFPVPRSPFIILHFLFSRSQALPGNALDARLCLADQPDWRQSLQGSAFPGRAWEREQMKNDKRGTGNEEQNPLPHSLFPVPCLSFFSRSQALPGNALDARLCLADQPDWRQSLGTRTNE